MCGQERSFARFDSLPDISQYNLPITLIIMTVPVQITNLIQIVKEHAPGESQAVEARLKDLEIEKDGLERYLQTLKNILTAAET